MGMKIDRETMDALKQIDTPTLCNAIERVKGKTFVADFMGMDIRCLLPQLGVMAGFAVTATVDSTTPDVPPDPSVWLDCLEAIKASPKPAVLVFKDVGSQVRKSAHLGEIMGTLAMRLGAVGIVTDGGVRDIYELEHLGFHCFAAGLCPSHGNPRIVQANLPVVIDSVLIRPGDLLHGDINGVTRVPLELIERIISAADHVHKDEAKLLGYIRSDSFTLEDYRVRQLKH